MCVEQERGAHPPHDGHHREHQPYHRSVGKQLRQFGLDHGRQSAAERTAGRSAEETLEQAESGPECRREAGEAR